MPKFAANLTMLFTEHPFLDRFEHAAKAGFKAVEFLFPYPFDEADIKRRLDAHGLQLVLHNLPAGNWEAGDRNVWGYRTKAGALVPLLVSGKREDGTRWGLVWNDDAKRKDGSYNKARAIETARYICRDTGEEFPDSPTTIARCRTLLEPALPPLDDDGECS